MRKKNSLSKFISIVVFLLLVGGGGFIFLSPQFEQNKPNISFETNGFWNLKDKLTINIDDESGIKYYKITFKDNAKEIILDEKILQNPEAQITLQLDPPKVDMFYKGEDVNIIIEAIDGSKWNFLNGNANSSITKLKIDTKSPIANVISNSRYIKRAGTALLIAKIEDKNLENAYIDFCGKAKYSLSPFYKENYFAALLPWDINIPFDAFTQITLVATDKAGNITQTKIPFYIQDFKEKFDDIKISDKFIESVSKNVLQQMGETIPNNLKEIFIKQNNNLRAKNVETIYQVAQKYIGTTKINNFNIKPFKRLAGSRTAAGYGEKRSYFYNDEKIDEAWHLGMDWASVKKATIRTTNPGNIIFNQYLGIYGNTLMIDHGLGLVSLYAHTTNQFVTDGEHIKANTKIATTGISGAVLGDHLHFGIVVQGVEVNPIEWMDKNWIKTRILDIMDEAKKTIDRDHK